MNEIKYYIKFNLLTFSAFVVIGVLIQGCVKNGDEANLSSLSSISLNTSSVFMYSQELDNSGNFLFTYHGNGDAGTTVVQKIDLKTLALTKRYEIKQSDPFGGNNIRVLADNGLLVCTLNRVRKFWSMLRLNSNLEVVAQNDSIPYMANLRGRICVNSQDQIFLAQNELDTNGRQFMSFSELDHNLNFKTRTTDTSTIYIGQVLGSDFINTKDGGFLYIARHRQPPFYVTNVLLEKRDKDLNLEWRAQYGTPGEESPFKTIEEDGKFYVYCSGTTEQFQKRLFVLVFDANGVLLQEADNDSGIEAYQTIESIVKTDDGNFLLAARTDFNARQATNGGILFNADPNLKNWKYKTFGRGYLDYSFIHKTDENRYLLCYPDNGFTAGGNTYRLVMRYMDGQGNFE